MKVSIDGDLDVNGTMVITLVKEAKSSKVDKDVTDTDIIEIFKTLFPEVDFSDCSGVVNCVVQNGYLTNVYFLKELESKIPSSLRNYGKKYEPLIEAEIKRDTNKLSCFGESCNENNS